jgi:glycosyltransferase involved in cell wall biosynthesis
VKIVYIANARIPSRTANSLQIMKVCAALSADGHDVRLIVPRFNRHTPSRESLEELYGVVATFRIDWLRGYRSLGRLWYEVRAVMRGRRLRADLYMTINERVAAALADRGAPTVCELHELPRRDRDDRAVRTLTHARGVRLIVVVTAALRELLLARYPDLASAPLLVEPNAVDRASLGAVPAATLARREVAWAETQLTVGYAGHLYAGRGVDLILALAARFPNVAFKVMGGEPEAVRRLQEDLDNNGPFNVELLGFVANARISPFLHACDILLMPYARRVFVSGGGETAGFASPMKMFDYMATGRLVIASRLPGIEEVLNERNALLCEPDDLESWAAALERAHDPALRDALASQARRDVERYVWDERERRILAAAGVTSAEA